MTAESPILKRTMLAVRHLPWPCILLRNSKGKFFNPDLTHALIGAVRANNLKKAKEIATRLEARRIDAGLLAVGSSDLGGVTSVTITEEWLGARVGIATVAEVKRPDWIAPKDAHEKEQANYIAQAQKRGCIAFFINNHEKLAEKIKEGIDRIKNSR